METGRRAKWVGTLAVSIALLAGLATEQAVGQDSKTLRLIAKKGGERLGTGTGFLWKGSDGFLYVVTSLHVVAGADMVVSQVPPEELVIVKMYKPADIALLRPKNPERMQGRTVMETVKGEIGNGRYEVFGFIGPSTREANLDVQFHQRGAPEPLNRCFDDSMVKDVIGGKDYPSPDTRVFQVSNLASGLSGAPIVEKGSNKVIAIGMGGLAAKFLSILAWALPADDVLAAALAKGEPGLGARRLGRRTGDLYSFKEETPVEGTEIGVVLCSMEPDRGKEARLVPVYTLPLSKVVARADEYALSFADGIVGDRDKGHPERLIDLYEDPLTGAIVLAPHGSRFVEQDGAFVLRSAGGAFEMRVFIPVVEEKTEIMAARDKLDKSLMGLKPWVPADEEGWEPPIEEEGILDQWRAGVEKGEDGVAKTYLLAHYTGFWGDGLSDFVGSSLVIRNVAPASDQFLAEARVLALCASLSGFDLSSAFSRMANSR